MQNYFMMWKIFLMQVMSPLLGGIGFISALMLFQAAPAKAEFWLGSPSWTKSWPSFFWISKHAGKFFFYQSLTVPLPPQFFFLLKQSTSFPDFISKKIILIDKILAFLQAFERVISIHDLPKWDLGRATCDITSGTELKDSRDFNWA